MSAFRIFCEMLLQAKTNIFFKVKGSRERRNDEWRLSYLKKKIVGRDDDTVPQHRLPCVCVVFFVHVCLKIGIGLFCVGFEPVSSPTTKVRNPGLAV